MTAVVKMTRDASVNVARTSVTICKSRVKVGVCKAALSSRDTRNNCAAHPCVSARDRLSFAAGEHRRPRVPVGIAVCDAAP